MRKTENTENRKLNKTETKWNSLIAPHKLTLASRRPCFERDSTTYADREGC